MTQKAKSTSKELFHLIKFDSFCPQQLKLIQKCTKAGAICNFLSVGMLEGRFQALKIVIVCFKISQLPPFAGHFPMKHFVISQGSDFQKTLTSTVTKLKVSSFGFQIFICGIMILQSQNRIFTYKSVIFSLGGSSFLVYPTNILPNNPAFSCVKNHTLGNLQCIWSSDTILLCPGHPLDQVSTGLTSSRGAYSSLRAA